LTSQSKRFWKSLAFLFVLIIVGEILQCDRIIFVSKFGLLLDQRIRRILEMRWWQFLKCDCEATSAQASSLRQAAPMKMGAWFGAPVQSNCSFERKTLISFAQRLYSLQHGWYIFASSGGKRIPRQSLAGQHRKRSEPGVSNSGTWPHSNFSYFLTQGSFCRWISVHLYLFGFLDSCLINSLLQYELCRQVLGADCRMCTIYVFRPHESKVHSDWLEIFQIRQLSLLLILCVHW
jgi:hypothetical protein